MAVAAQSVNGRARLLAAAGVLLLAACASSPPADRHGGQPPASVSGSDVTDASYDWHVLLLVPFGVLLRESPVPLHEVLLFHDETTRADSDNKDCFSIEGTPPRFLGQHPDHYLLCFEHDRLNRVDAAVRLATSDAPQAFARACALWLKNTVTTMGSGTTCEGRDGGVTFSGRLLLLPGDAAATVSMTLTDAPPPETAHDATVGN